MRQSPINILAFCLCFPFLTSCRQIMSFFALQKQDEPALYQLTGNPCLDKKPEWVLEGVECVHIEAHFVASAIAYVRTLAEVNQELMRSHNHEFEPIFTDTLDRLYKAISDSGKLSFSIWLRTKSELWSEAKFPDISLVYRLSKKLSYDYIMKEEQLGLSNLANALGHSFFDIMQFEKTKDYRFYDKIYRESLTDAEDGFATAAFHWSSMREDVAFRNTFRIRLRELLGQIMASRPKK